MATLVIYSVDFCHRHIQVTTIRMSTGKVRVGPEAASAPSNADAGMNDYLRMRL